MIIGAGPSGLVAAKEYLKYGNHVTIIESENNIGGLWYYESSRSSMYESLRTNLPREIMAFNTLKFDKNYIDDR